MIGDTVPLGCTLLLCRGLKTLSLALYDNTEDDSQGTADQDCQSEDSSDDDYFSWERQFLCGGQLTRSLLCGSTTTIEAAWDVAKERFRSVFKKEPIVGYIPAYYDTAGVGVMEWINPEQKREDQVPWEPKKQAPWKPKS
jgi:hypothetical protein